MASGISWRRSAPVFGNASMSAPVSLELVARLEVRALTEPLVRHGITILIRVLRERAQFEEREHDRPEHGDDEEQHDRSTKGTTHRKLLSFQSVTGAVDRNIGVCTDRVQ
jgi:hypothetical protein